MEALAGEPSALVSVRAATGREAGVVGYLPTLFREADESNQEALSEIGDKLDGVPVLPPVRWSVEVAKAAGTGKTVFEHAPESEGRGTIVGRSGR